VNTEGGKSREEKKRIYAKQNPEPVNKERSRVFYQSSQMDLLRAGVRRVSEPDILWKAFHTSASAMTQLSCAPAGAELRSWGKKPVKNEMRKV